MSSNNDQSMKEMAAAGPSTEKKNNKDIYAGYFKMEFNKTKGPNSFPAICQIDNCVKKEVAVTRKNKENGTWRGDALQNHLIEKHNKLWEEEIYPQTTKSKIICKRQKPVENATGERTKANRSKRRGACFACGTQYAFEGLASHRNYGGPNGKCGCPQFGILYENGLADELRSEKTTAEQRMDKMAEDLRSGKATKEQQMEEMTKFKSDKIEQLRQWIDNGMATIPVHVDDIADERKIFGVYLQLNLSKNGTNFELIAYIGKSKEMDTRNRKHRALREHWDDHPLKGQQVKTILSADNLTLVEAKALEYLTIQLFDIYGEKKPIANKLMPFPYIPHSQRLDAEHTVENITYHKFGRKIAAELVFNAIEMYTLDPKCAIELVGEDEENPANGPITATPMKPQSRRARKSKEVVKKEAETKSSPPPSNHVEFLKRQADKFTGKKLSNSEPKKHRRYSIFD